MDHKEAFELSESYSLGILEIDEFEAVGAHLATGCQECAEQLRELNELSAQLADSLPQLEPDNSVKERLMAKIRSQSDRTSEKSTGKFQAAGWVIATLAIAASLILTFNLLKTKDQVSQLRRTLSETQDVTDLLSSPGMKFVDLQGVEPNTQSFGKVVVDSEKGQAIVYMYRLPMVPKGMEYQLWVVRDGKPTSAGLFTVSEDGQGRIILDDMVDPAEIPTFLVTIEPEGGETTPTGMMYLTGP